MKKGLLKWFFASLGYLAYTLVVLIVLLWVLFPADSFRQWLQTQLVTHSPGLVWEIESVRTALPVGLKISGVSVHEKNDQDEPLLKIREIELKPPLSGLLTQETTIPVKYQVDTLGGTVRGQAGVNRLNGSLHCTGSIKNIQLNRLDRLWKKLNRHFSGVMSGNFEYTGFAGNFVQGDLQADLEVREGEIGLMQPIFGMESLAFSLAKNNLSMKDAVITVAEGEVKSRLLAGNYDGTISLSDSLATSRVDFQGSIEPRSELLGRMQNQTIVTLIRSQLQDGKLTYTLNGSLLEPGILFQGASGVIDGIIEGGLR